MAKKARAKKAAAKKAAKKAPAKKATAKKARKVNKSAKTGLFVTKEEVKSHPATTFTETVKPRAKKKRAKSK